MAPYTYTFTTSKAFDSGGQMPVRHLARCGAVRRIPTRPTPARWSWASSSGPRGTGRSAGSGSIRSRITPARHTGTLWTAGRHRAGDGDVHQRVDPGLGGTGLLDPGDGDGGDDLCGVVSHRAGHYAATSSGLSSAVANGPLTALANGGVYAYGSGHVPVEQLQRGELLGRRGVHPVVGRPRRRWCRG